jgi:Ni/Fe-hydrogenase subunit HybB-like protein
MVPGELWTLRDLFVLPNEYIYWSIQIVMYPFMTGLVAGAFVLSSLYHVFGIKPLKGIARFALVFSFALLPGALVPLLLHLQHPFRGINVLMTPHFTSAIAAFGIVFSTYFAIVASELWFIYRRHFVQQSLLLRKAHRTAGERIMSVVYATLTLGAYDVSEKALHTDEKATKALAALGIPVALFLHGYAGFIFGSVKANALWMTPLMPVIFIVSAIVSGIAFCMLTYILVMEIRKLRADRKKRREVRSPERRAEIAGAEVSVIRITSKYLVAFLLLAMGLELLDLVFRRYTAVKSWDVLASAVYGHEFKQVFVLQYGLGSLVPLILFLIPRLTVRRAAVGVALVLFGIFMMRWNVVIGGQSFSLTLAGYMHYVLPIVPDSWETLKEGVVGAVAVLLFPFVLFYLLVKICPVFSPTEPG